METNMKMASINKMSSKTAFFLCDFQEKFRPAIYKFDEVSKVVGRLVKYSKPLDIPLVVTEQYPKGLGRTIESLDIDHAALKVEKTEFSMFVDEVKKFLQDKDIKTVVLFGLETHVCILQTAMDLLISGINVHIVADGCSSRTQTDRILALDRLRQMGAIIVTHESVLFQKLISKDHEHFKEISKELRETIPDTGLLDRPSLI